MLDFFGTVWDLLLWMLVFFAWFAALAAVFVVIFDLFRDRSLKTSHKVIWFIVLLVLPFLGTLIYLIARGQGIAERNASEAQRAQAAQESYIREVAQTGAAAEIERAKALLDAGTISEAEFASLKAKALS